MIQLGENAQKISGATRANKNGPNNDIFTPPELAKEVWYFAVCFYLQQNDSKSEIKQNGLVNCTILDPCCGKGALLEPISERLHKNITAIDINSEYLKEVQNKYPDIELIDGDFMQLYNSPFGDYGWAKSDTKYDIILMNPPFSIERGKPNIPFWDHALSMLKDDGVIVSICPAYYLENNDARKKIYANNILETRILPKYLFETKKDGKKRPFHTYLVVMVKECANTTFLFL